MKRWIHAASAAANSSIIRNTVHEGCQFLRVDDPVRIRKTKKGYRLDWIVVDQFNRILKESKDPSHCDELGWSFNKEENTYPGTYDEYLSENARMIRDDFEELYEKTGIRFVFDDSGYFYYIPESFSSE